MEQMLLDFAQKQGIWALLFTALFFYVLKRNDAREKSLNNIIRELMKNHSNSLKDIKNTVDEVNGKVIPITAIQRDIKSIKAALVPKRG